MKKSNTIAAFALMLMLATPMSALGAGPSAINLLSAKDYIILTKSGISTTGSTQITGNIGVSPITSASITGFALTLPAAGAYATSSLVTGKIYAPDYASPTPANLSTAVSDMENAYTDGAGRSNPTATELGAGNIGGLTIAPGLYKWGTGVTIPTDVILSGTSSDVWIFQIAQTLNLSSGTNIVLSGGAKANNVYWIVGGQTTIGTTATFNGNILSKTAIVLNTGATLNGRALAQTAVTLDSNNVTTPSGSSSSSSTSTSSDSSSSSSTSSNNPTSNDSSSNPASTNPTNTSQNTEVVTNTAITPDTGCLTPLYKFSITTGRACASYVANSTFGQSVRMIATNLSQGSKNSSVTTLQLFLISQDKGQSARTLANVGATGYFGPITRGALAEYQSKTGILPALGNFGPITRAYIASH